jgi:hypothetical protein
MSLKMENLGIDKKRPHEPAKDLKLLPGAGKWRIASFQAFCLHPAFFPPGEGPGDEGAVRNYLAASPVLTTRKFTLSALARQRVAFSVVASAGRYIQQTYLPRHDAEFAAPAPEEERVHALDRRRDAAGDSVRTT